MGDLTEIYDASRYPEYSSQNQFEVNITREDLPKFSDPFEVGNYTEGYILGHINLYNVRVVELDNYASSKIEMDHKEKKVSNSQRKNTDKSWIRLTFDSFRLI